MSHKPLSPRQIDIVARTLVWMWPRDRLRTEQDVWRCLMYTKIIVIGAAAVLVFVLAFLVGWGVA